MKKFISAFLCFTLIFSMSSVAFAEESIAEEPVVYEAETEVQAEEQVSEEPVIEGEEDANAEEGLSDESAGDLLAGASAQWQLTEDPDTGVVTSAKLKISAVSGVTRYLISVEKNGSLIHQENITSTTLDCSQYVLAAGSGVYKVGVMAYKTGALLGIFETEELSLHTLTINTAGHGDNVVIKNVKDGTVVGNVNS